MTHLATICCCFCLLMLTAGPGNAQNSADEATSTARECFQKGTANFKEGKYQEALEFFLKGNEAKPSPVFLCYIADCHFYLKELSKAKDHYTKFIATEPSNTNPKFGPLYNKARERLKKIQQEAGTEPDEAPPSLTPAVEAPRPSPSVADQASPQVVRPRPVHQVEMIEAHTQRRIRPPVQDVDSGGSSMRTLGWVTLSLGVAGLAAGGICGAMAISKKGDLDEKCDSQQCQPAHWGDVDTYNTLRYATTGSLIGGGVLSAVALILVLTHPSKPAPIDSATLQPMLFPTSVGFQGRF